MFTRKCVLNGIDFSHDHERASNRDKDRSDRRSRDCDRYGDRDRGYDSWDREMLKVGADLGNALGIMAVIMIVAGRMQENLLMWKRLTHMIMSPLFLLHSTHNLSNQIAAA
ncbi:uncharacterized protein LOC141656246 isoform X2 [Silene latifolia]|uniref:uncharacterized protein LOC141656246 isoform X2 n=1 Tax=Silene latifolia TaxID=37657 RepID=UPI003D76D6F4